MNALVDATDEQMSMLDGLVSSLQSVEKTLAGVLATRDGLLALAGKLALSMAEEGDGIDASDLTIRTVAAEVGAVLRVSDRTVQRRMPMRRSRSRDSRGSGQRRARVGSARVTPA